MVDFKPKLPELFSISDVESVCRICLCPNNILLSIFENEIDTLISAFTLYKAYQNDGYPHQICPKCYKNIKAAYCFMKQCQSAHNFVKLFLKMPLSKKSIICYLCTTNFCNNSNLKRHLKNIHDLEWEIGTPRPDISHGLNSSVNITNIRQDINLKTECESCGKQFETEKSYKKHICANNDENNLFFMVPSDEKQIQFNLENSNLLQNANFGNLNGTPTHDISSTENKIALVKTPTFKDLLANSTEDEQTKMLSHLNLMPKEKLEEYEHLINLKKNERRRAYKILKNLSRDKNKSLLRTKKNFVKTEDGKFECSKCKKQYESINFIKRHELSHSKDPKPFACAICSREFSKLDFLKFHVKSAHTNTIIERPYQCVICKDLHIKVCDLLHHFQICGVQKPFCKDNAFLTYLRKELKPQKKCKNNRSILKQVSNIKLEECSNQSSINDNFINSKDEIASNFDQYDNAELPFDPINYCDTNFTDDIKYEVEENSFYKTDFNDQNSDQMFYEKNNVKVLKPFDVEGALDSDFMLKKMEVKERNSCGNFECEICKKEFSRKAHLQRHYLTHTTSKLFACEFCYTKFSCPQYVLTHMNRIHTDKVSQIINDHAKLQNYELVKINNEFSNKVNEFSNSNSQFIVRIKPSKQNVPKYDILKTKDGKFECKTCHKIFSRAEHVRRHELIHSDVPKPFICKFCSRVFSRADNLKKHLDFYCVKNDLLKSPSIPKSNLASSSKRKI